MGKQLDMGWNLKNIDINRQNAMLNTAFIKKIFVTPWLLLLFLDSTVTSKVELCLWFGFNSNL